MIHAYSSDSRSPSPRQPCRRRQGIGKSVPKPTKRPDHVPVFNDDVESVLPEPSWRAGRIETSSRKQAQATSLCFGQNFLLTQGAISFAAHSFFQTIFKYRFQIIRHHPGLTSSGYSWCCCWPGSTQRSRLAAESDSSCIRSILLPCPCL